MENLRHGLPGRIRPSRFSQKFRTILLRAALSLQVFCHLAVLPFPVVLGAPIDSALHLSATMSSADFCVLSAALRPRLPLPKRPAQTAPGTTRFFPSIHLPHLPPPVPCSYWTSTCVAALSPAIAFYAVSVRQARGFLHLPSDSTSRWTPLVFGYVFPATKQTPDFHRLETCAAGRTATKSFR